MTILPIEMKPRKNLPGQLIVDASSSNRRLLDNNMGMYTRIVHESNLLCMHGAQLQSLTAGGMILPVSVLNYPTHPRLGSWTTMVLRRRFILTSHIRVL